MTYILFLPLAKLSLSDFAAAAIHVGIMLNKEENQRNPLLEVLNNCKKYGSTCRRPSAEEEEKEKKEDERYILHYAVASAKALADDGTMVFSNTLFLSCPPSGEHAEELLLRCYEDRLDMIRSLYISYSPCSSCVVAIIIAFFARRSEDKPTIGFLWFHGNPEKCSGRHTKNNLRLLISLGFKLFIMNEQDVFMDYVCMGNVQANLSKSLAINVNRFNHRRETMANELEKLDPSSMLVSRTNDDCGCDCGQKCSTLLAFATFKDGNEHEETCAFRLLNILEHNSAVRTQVKEITFTYFPPYILSLRLIQVFHIKDPDHQPVIGFFAFKEGIVMYREIMESFTMLGDLFKFKIERCSSEKFNCTKHIKIAAKRKNAQLTRGDIRSLNNKAKKYLIQEKKIKLPQSKSEREASSIRENDNMPQIVYIMSLLSPIAKRRLHHHFIK